MSPEREPVIYVAIPVWRGEAVVEETLRSLLAQTWPSWRAVISVDGGDEGSAKGCRPFLADPRFSMVVQPARLGWAGNLNWLMARCDGDYFVYWQQDDLCSSNYLETLVGHTTRHPEAACAFADVQWFGARTELVHSPSVTGGALQRVLTQIETLDYLPFRGLITRRALAGAGPLRLATPEAAFEDLVWNVQLAREGELHAVAGALYFKRAHAANTHGAWMRWAPQRRRAAWMECAMGMLQATLPAFEPTAWPRLLEAVVDRFTLARPGRALIYDPATEGPAAVGAFATELLAEAERRFGVVLAPDGIDPNGTVAALLRRTRMRASLLAEMAVTLAAGRPVSFCDGADGTELLGRGWSTPEAWGVWSAAPTAQIVVPPLAGDRPWRLRMEGTAYLGGLPTGASRRIMVSAGAQAAEAIYVDGQAPPVLCIEIAPEDARQGTTLSLAFPDASSPAALGLSADTRLLAFALTALSAEPR